tara:strand:+ start:147 stop:341 length:195 start_codon:yes stop_codon:yes gene_type:complete
MVNAGNKVLIGKDEIAKVLSFIAVSGDPGIIILFQGATLLKGELHWIHGEEVNGVPSSYQFQQQ